MGKSRGKSIHRSRDAYGTINIVDDGFHRYLHLGSAAVQSAMDVHDPVRLVLGYTRAMMSFLLLHGAPRSVLCIGLGGGSLVKFLHHHFPHCPIDIVELRAEVIRLAEGYFCLPTSTPGKTYVMDGYEFVSSDQHGEPHYDIVMVDAYDAAGMADSVSARDFYAACRQRLAPCGMGVFNLWGSQPESFTASASFLKEVFNDHVMHLPVSGKGNIVTLAAPYPLPTNKQLKQLRTKADELEAIYGIEFPAFLRDLRRVNRSLLGRLLG